MKLDPRGSAVLGEDACRRHLALVAAESGTGRLALNGDPSPHVIPVNFTVHEGRIVVRLGAGWAAFHLDRAAVTFEADEATPSERSGWSVVVEGIARVVSYDEAGRLGANLPTPIVTEPGVRVFEIVALRVTGREIEPDLRGEPRAPQTVDPSGEVSTPPWELRLARHAAEELSSLINSVLGDLSSEIADTDNAAYRRALLDRRLVLEGIAKQLPTAPGG